MRSQVQVLAGPPPIVAGQSASGSEPGALAAGLGRAGAARPSPPARPVGPPGPPTRAPGSTTTTHRGHPPSLSAAAMRRVPPPRAAACSRGHSAAAREGRSDRRPGLPGRSVVKRGRRGPHPTRRPGSATDLPETNATAAASPASRPPRPSSSRRRLGSHGVSTRPVVTVARPPRPGSPTPPPEVGGDGRVRTDGQTPDGWTPHRRMDSRRPSAGPSGRRSQVTGQRTAGQPDPGRRNRMGGHRMLDTGDRRRGLPADSVDHGDDARPLEYRLDAARGRRRLGEQPPGPLGSTDAEGPTLLGMVWPPPRPSAAGGTPPSSWRLGALLSSDQMGGE
jgi:hypothetical protein